MKRRSFLTSLLALPVGRAAARKIDATFAEVCKVYKVRT